MQEQVDSKMLGSQDDTVEKNFSLENQSKEYRRKENQIQNKSSQVEPKVHFKANNLFCVVVFSYEFILLLVMNLCAGGGRGELHKFESKISFYR